MNALEKQEYSVGSAAAQGLASCHRCHKLSNVEMRKCSRCGSHLHLRKPNSVQTTLALLICAVLLYIPANIYPIMRNTLLGNVSDSTIVGGVWLFVEHGSYFIAFIIFFASVVIPSAKMMAIAYLCYHASGQRKTNANELTRVYRLTEFVGKWSMVDVFVVAILVALVQIGRIVSIQPGIAASAFAAVVILTMLSAHAFDVRLIWDKSKN